MAGLTTYVKSKLVFYGLMDPPSNEQVREIIVTAIRSVQDGKLDEAEEYLHRALYLAHETGNTDAELYALDVLANLFFEQNKLDEAESVFVDVMKRVMAKGRPKNDPAIIEMSLKLADIYAGKGLTEKAEQGYRFAVDEQRALARATEEAGTFLMKRQLVDHKDTDALGLLGMSLEAYSRFLIASKRYDEGLACFHEALEISQRLFGGSHPQSVTMMNNYATICLKAGRFAEAAQVFEVAAKKALHLPAFVDSLPGFYCNLAEAFFHMGEKDKSLQAAERALTLSKSCKDKMVARKTREFVQALQFDIANKKR